jgi:hypothetical protein
MADNERMMKKMKYTTPVIRSEIYHNGNDFDHVTAVSSLMNRLLDLSNKGNNK